MTECTCPFPGSPPMMCAQAKPKNLPWWMVEFVCICRCHHVGSKQCREYWEQNPPGLKEQK